jgi:hypothetical protein
MRRYMHINLGVNEESIAPTGMIICALSRGYVAPQKTIRVRRITGKLYLTLNQDDVSSNLTEPTINVTFVPHA